MNKFINWLFETWNGGYFCGMIAFVLSLIVLNNLWDLKPEPKTFEVVYTQDNKIYQMWDNGTYELLEYVKVNGDSVLVGKGTTKSFVEELKNKNIKKENKMFVWTIRDIIGFSFISIVLLYVLIKWLFYFYDRAIIKFNKWMGKE